VEQWEATALKHVKSGCVKPSGVKLWVVRVGGDDGELRPRHYINRKAPAKPTWCVAQREAASCLVVICSVIYSHSQQCQTDQNLLKVHV